MSELTELGENNLEENENSNFGEEEIDLEDDGNVNTNETLENSNVENIENDSELPNASEEPTEKLLRLPISRVKKIMKMDPDVNIASQEAVFLITKATVSISTLWFCFRYKSNNKKPLLFFFFQELLLDSLAKEAYSFTAGENKKTVTKKHLDSAINSIDALAFLDGALD